MKTILLAGTVLLAVAAAPAAAQNATAEAEILAADRAFAALAAEAGTAEAFARYLDPEDGRLLRGHGVAAQGTDEVRALMTAPEGVLLHWEPQEAFASAAGDFGASWGLWELHPDGDRTTEPAGRGSYLSVWRRDADGVWKALMDIGTQAETPADPARESSQSPADE